MYFNRMLFIPVVMGICVALWVSAGQAKSACSFETRKDGTTVIICPKAPVTMEIH